MSGRAMSLWLTGMLMLQVCPARAAVTLLLVRHAEVAARAGSDPPLSAAGRARARTLADMLAPAGVATILVSATRAARETAAPLARSTGKQAREIAPAGAVSLIAAIRELKDGVALVVSDRESIARVLTELRGTPVYIGEKEFDNLLVLSLSSRDTGLLRLHYGIGATSVGGTSNMQIRISRSGGITGMAFEVTVTLNGNTGKVTARNNYERNLEAAEVARLREAADPGKVDAARAHASASTTVYDSFQYDVSVVGDDGKEHTMQATHQPPPELGELIDWFDQERARISNASSGKP